ncbi:hypothetical protein YC2023_044671 [Brassica napus]
MAASIDSDHKLCGFLRAVVSVDSPHELSLGSSCFISNDGFKSDNGVILSLVNSTSNPKSLTPEIAVEGDHDVDNRGSESTPKRRKSQKPKSNGRGKKMVRSIGMVNGSMSVVNQLHALVANKCLKMECRVVKAEKRESGEERAVVLVDVYMPVALWSGWQFPKCQATAAALFKHLSCDWGLRSSILSGESIWEEVNGRIKAIWDLSDCHVFGCKLHCNAPDSPGRRLFKLHEIFQSLPSPGNNGVFDSSRILPSTDACASGIWDLPDDVLTSILMKLNPKDLVSVAGACRLFRSLAFLIVPCMNLKLFPHQQSAVGWMLERERKPEVFSHPLYLEFSTEDGFSFYINVVSGDITTEEAPMVKDFRGGMFCDEPGLGKTITALSLILKTLGTMADPPEGLPVIWCTHKNDTKCGYYEYTSDQITSNGMLTVKRFLSPSSFRSQLSLEAFSPLLESKSLPLKQASLMGSDGQTSECKNTNSENEYGTILDIEDQRRQSLGNVRKNLLPVYNGVSELSEVMEAKRSGSWKKFGRITGCKRKGPTGSDVESDIWVQCDACSKWRRIVDDGVSVTGSAWFCSNNADPAYQSCKDPEQLWDRSQPINYLQGFYTKGASGEENENISFFTSVLRKHKSSVNSNVNKALIWLAKRSLEQLSLMETVGLPGPPVNVRGYQRLFHAFGLTSRVEKGVTRWFYPKLLENLVFDSPALKVALCQPLDAFRLYLSKATLIVVPANLVDHWKTQIDKHVSPGQLRILVWTDNKKLSPHNLAWDYDVVITTFSRLSAEWNPRKKSPLIQVHWLRVMLDEGHTLGSSLSLTNKFQMAVSLTASSRWLLTGTPTPNTPNSQLSHLQPLLKFLHEEDIKETMDALVEGGLDDSTVEYSSIQNCLISGCNCKRCGEWCRLPVITPCRHLLCLDCVSLDSERCTFPGCGYLYEMQTLLARPENPNPKWPVPKDLIELQPSYNQDDWNPDWQSTSSSKVSYLVDRLKKLHEGNRKSILSFNKSSCDNLEENIPGTSKAFLGQDLRSQMVLVDKVLIFSQFLEHIHVIEQQLEIAGIKFAGMYSPMPSSKKMKNLAMFQNDADCMALLMDGSAALGLDLSFVTHVFLMEPIWDKSMEEQVISRAHRMGAKRPIYVETLTMRGTIEEQMMRFLEDAEKSDRLSSGDYIKVEQETTRSSRRTIHDLAESNYLSHLIFVRSEGNT